MTTAVSHHSPPQGVGVAVEALAAGGADHVLLTKVHEVTGEDQGEESNVEGRDELLEKV